MAVSSSCHKSHPVFHSVVHNGRLKTWGINWTRLLSANSKLETAQPKTGPLADHAGPTIDFSYTQEDDGDNDSDSDEEISKNKNVVFQVSSCQPMNSGLLVRQTGICRVVYEAKGLVPGLLCSTRAQTAATAQAASLESPSLNEGRSDNKSSDTAGTTSGAVPIQDVHT